MPLRELGRPKKLGFAVVSFDGGANDAAPDGGSSRPPDTHHYVFKP
jgi:hypothetical protein